MLESKYMTKAIQDIVAEEKLPDRADDIIPLISNGEEYISQEGETWDFKETWPFSYSDDYFGGLARLVCAFANTSGGLIIFGVDDNTRKGGRTKTQPNVDRFEQAFEQLTGVKAPIQLRRYKSLALGDVDVLLVSRKKSSQLPFRFCRKIGSYPTDVIWVRRGSEVRAASSADIPLLYLRGVSNSIDVKSPIGHLPPSPSTVKEFVGRMITMDRVFKWISKDDEPRAFLFGKGGSGKSTIAFEVFKHIRSSGGTIKISDENEIEKAIFVSAKQKFLDVEKQAQSKFLWNDFDDECTLYTSILISGGYPPDLIFSDDIVKLKDSIKDFFNNHACFLVIDDIDTLTTAGVEAGIDFLYGVLWKSQKRSKVLYTLRNRPTHSIRSSIEVSGLDNDEYDQFLDVCSEQFKVAKPSKAFADGALKSISEGRPLVIESIVALRRHAGSYELALSLFEKGSGDDVRSYVFRREWDALDPIDKGRELLAILAINGEPLAFDDLVVISQVEQSRVKDGIASVQEMFLTTEDAGANSLYSLGDLTKAFVMRASLELDLIDTIKARVRHYRSSHYPDRPELSRLQVKMERALPELRQGDLDRMQALAVEMNSRKFEPSIFEDPRFLALRGYVQLLLPNGSRVNAREDLRRALSFKFSPDEAYIRAWFEMERNSDTGDERTKEIAEAVVQAKGYSQEFKSEVRFWRASYLYTMARQHFSLEPEKSVERLFDSLENHMICFSEFLRLDSYRIRRSEEYTKNTAYFLIQKLIDSKQYQRIIKFFIEKSNNKIFFDALVEPMIYIFQIQLRYTSEKSDLHRLEGHLNSIIKNVGAKSIWHDDGLRVEFIDGLRKIEVQIQKILGHSRRAQTLR